jgi:hypothetical protein
LILNRYENRLIVDGLTSFNFASSIMITRMKSNRIAGTLIAFLLCLPASASWADGCKTLGVEHGKPIICVSQNSVLVLELAVESRAEAAIRHVPRVGDDWRARYRYKVYERSSGTVREGRGMVNEHMRVVSVSAAGRNVEDAGSTNQIVVGDFSIGWSPGTPGSKSWLYYRSNSAIRLIQQEPQISFETIGQERLQHYQSTTNIVNASVAGRTIQVMGPAVFSGDIPTTHRISARIRSCQMVDGAFHINLMNLSVGTKYVIERSLVIGEGQWTAVDSILAKEPDQSWADAFRSDIDRAYYRIRHEPDSIATIESLRK